MNLTKSIKQFLLKRFLDGGTIMECAVWYEQKPVKIENALREAMREALKEGKNADHS